METFLYAPVMCIFAQSLGGLTPYRRGYGDMIQLWKDETTAERAEAATATQAPPVTR